MSFMRSNLYLLYLLFSSLLLVSPVLADEDNGVAVGREAVAREVDVVADALRRVAVVTHAVEAARSVAAQTRRVDGSSGVAGTGQGGLEGRRHLVHPDEVDDVVRSPGDGCDTIAAAVDVDDDAVLGDGIGTGQEVVHVHRAEVTLTRLLGRFGLVAVDDLVLAATDEVVGQTHLTDGLRAAPGDAAALGHERLDKTDGLGGCGAVVGIEVAALQMLDDAPCQLFVMDFDRSHWSEQLIDKR